MTKRSLNLRNAVKTVAVLAVTSLMFSCRPAPEKLFDAIEQNDAQQVKELIAKRVDVNASNDKNLTALFMAAKKGNVEIAEALIAAGANVNHKLLVLSSQGAPAIYTAIMYAVDGGNAEVVKVLLTAGADANAGNMQDRKTPLIMAVMGGNSDIVEALLNAGADANTNDGSDFTALMAAAEKGHNEIIKLLINAGSDVNAVTKNIYDTTQSGLTALMFAAFNGQSEAVKLLLSAGADVSLKSGAGNNAREIAVYKGNNDIVRLIDDATQK